VVITTKRDKCDKLAVRQGAGHGGPADCGRQDLQETTMWDSIVIGSGIGGLSAAAALAHQGQRVLVLEQHSVAGGQTQTFTRGAWRFATGLHYIGGVGPYPGEEGQFGRVLDGLSNGALRFAESANPYDIVRTPGFEFGIRHPQAAYQQDLLARFPEERAAIEDWFEACEAARRASFTLMAEHAMPAWLAKGLHWLRGAQAEHWAQRTVADELARVHNPQLRAVLGARWGDHGAPPAQAPLAEHALVMGSFNAGSWYPVGGPERFAQTLVPVIEASGGQVLLGADVRAIELHDGRASGVRFVHAGQPGTEQQAAAPHIISAMGVHNTLAALPAEVAAPWREEVQALQPGLSYVALYLGLEGDIASAGASSANHWIYESDDVGRVWRQPADEDAPGLFVSFPSLKDPDWQGPPTAEVLALTDGQAFAPWLEPGAEGDSQASADYAAFKDWVAARLRAQFERHFPALAPMVRFQEAATPLTQQRFVRTPSGAMYGLEMTADRLGSPALRLRTPVPGLLLAGQDVTGPGVQAACMGGMMAAATVDPRVWRRMA
jgi:all-trans-retinol 13,14-reductase